MRYGLFIGLDKSRYQVYILFLQENMLWVLIRSTSFLWRNKKNINTFELNLIKSCADSNYFFFVDRDF